MEPNHVARPSKCKRFAIPNMLTPRVRGPRHLPDSRTGDNQLAAHSETHIEERPTVTISKKMQPAGEAYNKETR